MQSTFGIDPADVIRISAKTGSGVETVLKAIIERIPPPTGRPDAPLKAFLFDSLSVYPIVQNVISHMFVSDTTDIEV